MELVGTEKRAERIAADPAFRASYAFTENLLAVERYTTKVSLDKPIYTGASVLDLSKLLMLDFHYDFIKEQYPDDKSALLFTDTDSLLYSVESSNIYDDMRLHHEQFDVSNYPDSHEMFRNDNPETIKQLKKKNKKVVGKMKDEAGGDLIMEFVGLRAKAYAYRQETWDEKDRKWKISELKKLKGVKKCVVKKKIQFDQYKDCLFSGNEYYETMRTFRSYGHTINTIDLIKKSLSSFDDKRYIFPDGIKTNAHGHIDNLIEDLFD